MQFENVSSFYSLYLGVFRNVLVATILTSLNTLPRISAEMVFDRSGTAQKCRQRTRLISLAMVFEKGLANTQ
jgi:hypothetical protein